MNMSDIPFGTTDWATVETTEHKGETGMAYWRTRHFGDIRVRMVTVDENGKVVLLGPDKPVPNGGRMF